MVVFPPKLCCGWGVHFPKIVVGVGVVVIKKSKNCGCDRGWGGSFWKNCVVLVVVVFSFPKFWLWLGCGSFSLVMTPILW